MKIENELKKALVEKGISNIEFSKMIGKSRNTVQNILSGRTQISYNNVIKYFELINTPIPKKKYTCVQELFKAHAEANQIYGMLSAMIFKGSNFKVTDTVESVYPEFTKIRNKINEEIQQYSINEDND